MKMLRRRVPGPSRTHRSAAASAGKTPSLPSPPWPSSRTQCRRSTSRSRTKGATTNVGNRPAWLPSGLGADRIERWLTSRGPFDVRGNQCCSRIEHTLRPTRYMWGHDHVAEFVERLRCGDCRPGRCGIAIPDIEGSTSKASARESSIERRLVDDLRACDIDQVRHWLHQAQALRV